MTPSMMEKWPSAGASTTRKESQDRAKTMHSLTPSSLERSYLQTARASLYLPAGRHHAAAKWSEDQAAGTGLAILVAPVAIALGSFPGVLA